MRIATAVVVVEVEFNISTKTRLLFEDGDWSPLRIEMRIEVEHMGEVVVVVGLREEVEGEVGVVAREEEEEIVPRQGENVDCVAKRDTTGIIVQTLDWICK